MKIYTKTGDDGTSGLADGKRIEKDSPRLIAIGEVDELNALLGVIKIYTPHLEELNKILNYLQNTLFVVGADLATANEQVKVPRVGAKDTEKLEKWIDQMTSQIKPLRHFILPGGNVVAAYLHLARAVCRRAERAIVTLKKNEDIASELVIFINRLSDLLFTMARYANHMASIEEIVWKSDV